MDDRYFIVNGVHVLGVILLMAPLFGVLAMPLGIFFFQSRKDGLGNRVPLTLNIFDYRAMLLKIYAFLVVGLFAGVVSAGYGLTPGVGLTHSLVVLAGMGAAANIAAKRLRGIDRSVGWALLGVIPVIGPAFLWFLAFRPRPS